MRYLALIACLCLQLVAKPQASAITEILKLPEQKIPAYSMHEAGSWVLFLPMAYGESGFYISQEHALSKLKNAQIARVDLVYSDYPAGQDFTALTRKRLMSLEKWLPGIFRDKQVVFRRIRQTRAKNRADAERLSHGFFIYYREKPSAVESKAEIGKMIKELKSTSPDPEEKKEAERLDSLNNFWCGTQWLVVDTTGVNSTDTTDNIFYVPPEVTRHIEKWSTKEYIKSKTSPEINPDDYLLWDSVYHISFGDDCPDYSDLVTLRFSADSTVSRVFNRHPWRQALVMADVTGSMYPYTGQLLQWLRLTMTDKAKRYFLFFNDGDNKPDEEKTIGYTGGIYSVHTADYDEVEKTIVTAMTNGCGGDAPENNLECLLAADKLCPSCDTLVMIADNWAPLKDLSLLKPGHKAVKLVLCGVIDRVNPDYLKLVRNTGGSLHLMEEDIYTLAELKEGETILIHGVTYQLRDGEFMMKKDLSL